MIIYKAVNKINGKMYIGQTVKKLETRINEHKRCYKTAFGAALRKYGIYSFNFLIVELCKSKDELNQKEIYWIKHYGCLAPVGYNLNGGGNGTNPSEETRAKFRLINLGRKRTELEKEKNRIAHLGCTHTEETKKKQSQSLKKRYSTISHHMIGKSHSEETRKKMSESHIGKNTGNKNGMYGKPSPRKGTKYDDGTKQAISESVKKLWSNPEYVKKIMLSSKSKSEKLKLYWSKRKESTL